MNKELKQAFEEWYLYTYLNLEITDKHINKGYILIDIFKAKNSSEQFGVYQDFYDSVGIDIGTYKNDTLEWFFGFVGDWSSEHYQTRPQAREQALIKAAEIWTDQNK